MSKELLNLVQACKEDDKKAWGPFVTEGGKIIRGILWKPCGGKREEIDEITQRVWIKLLKGGLSDFRGTSQYQFLAYLKTITINEANTYFRSKQHSDNDDETITARPTFPSGRSDDEAQAGEVADPEKIVIRKDEVERLRACLKGLRLELQEIAAMKAKGYKDSEIGKILGLPLGTVAVSYSRLKKKLRECMDRE